MIADSSPDLRDEDETHGLKGEIGDPYRNGPAAIQYATRACELSSWKKANDLDTLAAAYAETRQFKEAIQWQTSALEAGGNIDRDAFEARLAMYHKHKPFHSDDTTACFF